jgi:general secretion pathway protein G
MKVMKAEKGFTLVEILTVLVLIGILVSIALPIYHNQVVRAKESVLKENLWMIREALNQHYHDKGKYPNTLDDLVLGKYLRKVPMDPVTNSSEWELIHFEPEDPEDFDPEIAEGIIDVKSLSDKESTDGTPYNEW